ncbi:methyl-accepting chemotaxis protein [Massilia niastensis]|uniref:methyl-accepting chemotaxis protein n=1 Tax=Massilia niastensis TaxID=544911 RepID=UPI0003A37FE6|nr:methyl-accepting chemotaxis protein [Massilia niastensis]
MTLRKMKIGPLLSLGFAAVLLLMLLLVGTGLSTMDSIDDMTHDLTVEQIRKSNTLQEWKAIIEVNTARTIAVAKATDPATEQYFLDAMGAASKRADELQKTVQASVKNDPQGLRLFEQVVAAREAYRGARQQAFKQKAAGELDAAARFFETDMLPRVNDYVGSLNRLVEYQKQAVATQGEAIEAAFSSSRKVQLGLSLAALATGALFAWLIQRAITAPLRAALQVARTVASGNLGSHIEVESDNETGQLMAALKDMNDSLRGIVGQVRQGTETIASASHQIAGGNLELSARTEQQASSLEETASSMEELTATVKRNADNASQANTLALDASSIAARGGATVTRVVATMDEISAASRRINDIVAVIDGIAFQTNILALNAAVEAARAGEQGRGFAVVASEVRALAQRSATAAKEIKTLIQNSAGKVEEGSRLVGEAGTTMREIVTSIDKVAGIMSDIAVASGEQSSGIEQVNRAVAQMDQVTQQNAALVEEAAAASDALREQAAALSQLVGAFHLEPSGSAAVLPFPERKQLGHARQALAA